LKKRLFYILCFMAVMACNKINTPTNKSIMLYNVALKSENILCDGSGLSFGNCVAKQMKEGKCIGIAKHDGTHVAVEIPCELMFRSAIDTLNYPEDRNYEELLNESN